MRQLSATTGLPHVLVRRNMEKIRGVLDRIETVLAGLTRGLDLAVLDRGGRDGRPRGELRPALADARRRAAEQLPRRPLALGAGDRAQDGAGAQARQRRALDALPPHPGVRRGRRAGRGVRLLPHRPRGRGRDPAPLRARHGVRRRGLDAAVAGRPARRGPRPGLQQGGARPRRGRRLGEAPRRDGLVDRRERRPLLRQRLGRLDDGARPRDRRGARARLAAIVPRARGRPGGPARAVREPATWRGASRR